LDKVAAAAHCKNKKGRIMFLTPEQLHIIEDALEFSCTTLTEQFEENKHRRENDEVQKSVVVYGKLRRYNKLLNDIKKNTNTVREVRDNNVLVLAGDRRR